MEAQITGEILEMHGNEWIQQPDNPKPMGFSKSSAKGKVHGSTSLPQEARQKSNK